MIPAHPPVRVLSLTLTDSPLKKHGRPGTVRALATVSYHGIIIAGIPLIEHPGGWRVGAPARPDPTSPLRPVTIEGADAKAAIFRAITAAYSAMTGHAPPSEYSEGGARSAAPTGPWARPPAASRDVAFPSTEPLHG
jgi:DNA-binding cell septation regulator SpoVG